ncbi:MAG: tetratricopeptide repeat protein [Luteolibacter sp.]
MLWISASASLALGESLLDYSFGVLEGLRGEEEKAAAHYESAFESDPTALPLVRLMAGLRMEAGNRSGAIGVWNGVLKERPDEARVWLEYGNFLGDVGRGDELADMKREEAYLNAWRLMPGEYAALERLIVFAREQEDDDDAREYLEKLELDSPEAVRYYVSSTKSLYDGEDEVAGKRIDEAFQKAMGEHPEWAGIARAASEHFRQTGRLEEAINVLSKHVQVSPFSLDLRVRLGILMFSAGRDDEGLVVLNDVLDVHPGKVLAHESLAKFFREEGKLEKALAHEVALLKIRGGSPEEFIELADGLGEAGQYREARILLEKAVFDHEENADLMMKLALATARDPETKDKAARLFREAEALLKSSGEMPPEFLLESAKELVAQGQNGAAEERLKTAIRSFPKGAKKETAEALRALAGIWKSEGRNENAARALISRAEGLEE